MLAHFPRRSGFKVFPVSLARTHTLSLDLENKSGEKRIKQPPNSIQKVNLSCVLLALCYGLLWLRARPFRYTENRKGILRAQIACTWHREKGCHNVEFSSVYSLMFMVVVLELIPDWRFYWVHSWEARSFPKRLSSDLYRIFRNNNLIKICQHWNSHWLKAANQ